MNYVSFSTPNGSASWGVAERGTVHDLGPSGKDLAPSLHAAVVAGLFGRLGPADLEGATGEDGEPLTPADLMDLAEARSLIIALAGLVTAAAPEIGSQHARALRDGLRSLQLAFREASVLPDAPGQGPGEKLTGPVR